MTPAITTHALTKRYGELRAVDGVGLTVSEGDIYGFLGANGSGKTTTIRMLLGLVLPTSGQAEVLGRPIPAARSVVLPMVGALVEGPGAYPHLSGRANLALLESAAPGGHPRKTRHARFDEVLDLVGLDPRDRRPTRAYSLGMRQRLGLAAALVRRPRLLVLDEPTNGLDPQGIQEIRRLLLELNRGGTTIFLSSHLLSEIEQLCTRVGVLDRGRLVVEEPLATLLRPSGLIALRTLDVQACLALLGSAVVSVDGERLLIRADDAAGLNAVLVASRRTGRRDRRAPARPGAGRSRCGGLGMIGVELIKLVRRPRTWVIIGMLLALPTLVAILLAITDLGPRPGTGPPFLSAVLSDGTLFPLAALGVVLPLFLPIAVAVLGGDAIAGETQTGTLRYLLLRPVSRTRLLVAKLISVVAFVVIAVLAVAAVTAVEGRLLLGRAETVGTVSLSGSSLSQEQIAGRTAMALGYVIISMLGVAAVALFFSTVTSSAIAAALGTVGLLIASTVLLGLDAAQALHPFLPTRYWLSFVDLFRDPILWDGVVRGLVVQLGYLLVFSLAAWANFLSKDIDE